MTDTLVRHYKRQVVDLRYRITPCYHCYIPGGVVMDLKRLLLIIAGLAVVLLIALFLWNRFWVERRVLWTYQATIQDGISEFDCCADGGVVLTTNYDIRRLDSAGRLKWKTPRFSQLNAFTIGHIYADPYHDRSLYVTNDGCVLAFDSAGNHLWTCGTPSDDPCGQVIDFATDGTIAVAFCHGGLKYIDSNGNLLQTIPLDGYHGNYPASIGPTGNIYYIYSEGLVFNGQTQVYPNSDRKYARALDKHGNELWRYPGDFLAAYDRLHPLDADTVLIGHRRVGLVAFDARGEQLWQADCPTDFGNNVVIDSERIYVSGHEGLRAFSHSGSRLWELPVTYWTSNPAVNDRGVVFCHEEYVPAEIIQKGDTATDEEWANNTADYLLAVDSATGELIFRRPWESADNLISLRYARTRPDGSVVILEGHSLRCLQP